LRWLPIAAFHRNTRDGLQSNCKDCRRQDCIKSPELKAQKLALLRAWIAKNPERAKAAIASWQRRNPKKARKYRLARRARAPERYLAQRKVTQQRRRALQLAVPGSFTLDDWVALVKRSPSCHWCKRPWTKRRRPTHDHVIPLSDKGPNTPDNSVCACSECNTRKGNRRFNPVNGQGILV
jgi:5-methylcytosine-specific restriction endonuclease McrA